MMAFLSNDIYLFKGFAFTLTIMAFIEDLLSVFQEVSEDEGNSNFTYTIV